MSLGSEPSAAGKPRRASRSSKEKTRLIVVGAAVALAIIFAVLNLHRVSVNWIVTTSHTPLTIVIVISFLIGAAVGALMVRRASR